MRKHGTDRDGCNFDPERVQEVWDRGRKIPGKDPDLYRRDSEGNELYRHAYGKHGDQSWQGETGDANRFTIVRSASRVGG